MPIKQKIIILKSMNRLGIWSLSTLLLIGAMAIAISWKLDQEQSVFRSNNPFQSTTVSVTPFPLGTSRTETPSIEGSLAKFVRQPDYPQEAIEKGQKGTSEVEVILKRDLSLSLRVTKSSGSEALDKASLEALRSIPRDELRKNLMQIGASHHRVKFEYDIP